MCASSVCRLRRLPSPVSGSVLACDSSSRERVRTSSSTAAAWIAPVASASRSTASAKRSGSFSLSSSRRARTSTACSAAMSRATSAALVSRPLRSPASAAARCGLLLAQLVGVAVGARDLLHDVADQLGQLARDLLGRELADLLERGALDQPDEPCLGELVPRAVEAREWAPDRCHAFAVTGWTGSRRRLLRSYSRKRRSRRSIHQWRAHWQDAPRMADLIAIAEARRRVLERGPAAAGRARGVSPRRSGGCSPRTWRAPSRCRPSTAPPWTATPWSPARPAELEVVGEARAGHPASVAVTPGHGDRDLDRRRGARGRDGRGAGRAHRASGRRR